MREYVATSVRLEMAIWPLSIGAESVGYALIVSFPSPELADEAFKQWKSTMKALERKASAHLAQGRSTPAIRQGRDGKDGEAKTRDGLTTRTVTSIDRPRVG